MFSLSTNLKIDMKKCQNRRNREARTQTFSSLPNHGGRQVDKKFPIPTNAEFFSSLVYTLMTYIHSFIVTHHMMSEEFFRYI